MKLGFDQRALEDHRGIGRFSRNLLAALQQTAPTGWTVVACDNPKSCDVWFAPSQHFAKPFCRAKQIVMLHDLVPYKQPKLYTRFGYKHKLMYWAVTKAEVVLTPTRVVADEANQLLGIAQSKIFVLHEAADDLFAPASDQQIAAATEKFALPDRFLLWVGGMDHEDPRKRVRELVDCQRSLPLVLVGRTADWITDLQSRGQTGGQLNDGLILTGEVSDDDLQAIYSKATALILPSDDEGFGLTPHEALACGTQVVCRDLPVLHETLGGFPDAHLLACDTQELVDFACELAARGKVPRIQQPAAGRRRWADAASEFWQIVG